MSNLLGITDPITYVLGVIFVVLLPGPNSMYVLSLAASRGVREGYKGACGIFVGDTVLMLCAALGAASLLRAYPPLFYLIKYAGAAYLSWIGINLILNAWFRLRRPDAPSAMMNQPIDTAQPFRKALIISLLNPKAILFCISFFIQFVDPEYAYPAISFSVLGLVLQFFSALYLSALIFAGHRLAEAFRRRRVLGASMTGGVGAAFLGFGVKLATASLN